MRTFLYNATTVSTLCVSIFWTSSRNVETGLLSFCPLGICSISRVPVSKKATSIFWSFACLHPKLFFTLHLYTHFTHHSLFKLFLSSKNLLYLACLFHSHFLGHAQPTFQCIPLDTEVEHSRVNRTFIRLSTTMLSFYRWINWGSTRINDFFNTACMNRLYKRVFFLDASG